MYNINPILEKDKRKFHPISKSDHVTLNSKCDLWASSRALSASLLQKQDLRPYPELQDHFMHLNKIPKIFMCTLWIEKQWC
jgi:hypothetical protein